LVQSIAIGAASYSSGDGSIAVGTNTTANGTNNVSLGEGALTQNANSIAMGYNSRAINNNSIACGAGANANGVNSTSLGYSASANNTNSTALGYGALANSDNMVRVGNISVAHIEGAVAYSNPSDARLKTNIAPNVPGLEFINLLRPVTYTNDADGIARLMKVSQDSRDLALESEQAKVVKTGFIAQEVESAANQIGFNFDAVKKPQSDDGYYSLSYAQFVVPLVKACQEQQALINTLMAKIAIIEAKLA
jgi:autotransporter adhesin